MFGWHHVQTICFLKSGFTSFAYITYGTMHWGSGAIVAQQKLLFLQAFVTFMCVQTPRPSQICSSESVVLWYSRACFFYESVTAPKQSITSLFLITNQTIICPDSQFKENIIVHLWLTSHLCNYPYLSLQRNMRLAYL